MHTGMKDNIQKEYNRRLRQLTSLKVNDGNTIRAKSPRAVSSVSYSAGILKCTKDELKVMDRKTRRIIAMNRMYHSYNDTDRLYISRIEGGQGLLSVSDCLETEERNLFLHLDQLEERLLRLSKSEISFPEYEGSISNRKKKKDTSNGKRNSSMVNL